MAMSMAQPNIQILAIPFPTIGHKTALLQLCRILIASNPNITITVLNTDLHNHNHNDTLLYHNLSPQETLNLRFASLDVAYPFEKPPSMSLAILRFILFRIDELEAPTHRFVSKTFKNKPDFLLSDVYIGWVQDMATQLGIPRIALWTSSASECLVYHHTPNLIARSILPFKVPKGCGVEEPDNMTKELKRENHPTFHRIVVGSEDDIVVEIPGLPPLHRGEFPSFLQIEDGDDIIFNGFIKHASRMVEANIVLINTFYGLETQAIKELKKAMRLLPIGPMFLMDKLHEYHNKETKMIKVDRGQECLEWLDKKPKGSVVYVAFGSTLPLKESQVGEIAAGLETCGHPFLWSLLKECAPPPKGFLERCKDRGIIVSWAPQTLVLDHPSIGVFLTHCGWNSSIESIALGVPLICCPLVADQFINAKMIVEEWGLGLSVATEGKFLTAEGLTSIIQQFLNNDGIGASFEIETRGCAIRAKARALQQVVSMGIASNLDDTLHCPSYWEALHNLLQFIGSKGQSE